MVTEHSAPWWFKLAERVCPSRTREIPEAQNPDRIVLRQVALIGRHLYLQNFASSEDPRYLHSHQWFRTFALGLWGGYVEHRLAGPSRVRRAPYFYTMDASVIHRVAMPSSGHTSLFLGLWREDSLKHYFGTPTTIGPDDQRLYPDGTIGPLLPATYRSRWETHILRWVKRI